MIMENAFRKKRKPWQIEFIGEKSKGLKKKLRRLATVEEHDCMILRDYSELQTSQTLVTEWK